MTLEKTSSGEWRNKRDFSRLKEGLRKSQSSPTTKKRRKNRSGSSQCKQSLKYTQ